MRHRKQKQKELVINQEKKYISQLEYLLTPRAEVIILDHTDGVVASGHDHGPYLSVGVVSDVILQNSVDKLTTVINTTCRSIC